VYLGKRHAPKKSSAIPLNNINVEDGGLDFYNFAQLIEILLVKEITPSTQTDDLKFFSEKVDPLRTEPNSEVFLFKYGSLPLWESMPEGANLDVDFTNPEIASRAWECIVQYFLSTWVWHKGIKGFSFVKRFNGDMRMSLWIEQYDRQTEMMLRSSLPAAKIMYRTNMERISKHAYHHSATAKVPSIEKQRKKHQQLLAQQQQQEREQQRQHEKDQQQKQRVLQRQQALEQTLQQLQQEQQEHLSDQNKSTKKPPSWLKQQ